MATIHFITNECNYFKIEETFVVPAYLHQRI